ncbi:MAG: DUF4838 domain-containing protein [Lentisphaeria bacterium]|nr:DUF4838 domain-containing protein [Lentisphaeria bacterium]
MSIVKNFMLSTALLMSLQLSADFKLAGSSIYVGQDQPESVYEASEELQLHIKKATGLDLPIVYTPAKGKMIVVGDNELSRKAGIDTGKMEYQGHRILTKGNNLYIVGRDVAKDAKLKSGGYSFGTLYAVYSFLSRTMGIRWILPSDKGMHIPNLGKDYTVPDLDITYVPAFKARITYIPKVWMRSPEYRKWMQRNYHRLPNLRNVHDQVFGSLGIAFSHSWEDIYPKKKSALFESAFDTFKKHPDFFWANSAGKRMEPIHNAALCISNPELLKDISERYIKWAESKKAVHISISPSDGTACSCKNCTANPIDLSHIGEYRAAHVVKKGNTPLYLDYYRYVTERVTKKYPEMLLTGLIYNTYLYAPKQKPARMPDNFIPWMAPLNISYGPSRIYEGINRSWHSWLDGWSGVFKNIAYFGYDFYLNTYGTNVPWPTMAPILNETLQTLRKNNCVGIFNAGLGALGTQGINNWLLLQSDFYPEDDYVKLAKLYNSLAYGKGGDEINQIYEIIERNLKAYVTSVKGKMSYYITPELMKDVYAKDWNQIRALMVKAKAAPKDAGQTWRFEHFERNMKITEYFLRRMTMIPADEKSPLYISEKELLELRPRLGINADLEFYTEPLYSAAYASYIKQVVVKPTVLKGKEPFKSGTFFLSRDYVVYAPEDMEICMKFETGCLNTDPRTGKPYLKPMPQFQVLDSNRKTVCEGLGDLKDGSIRFKGKKGEHYYVIFAPTTAVEFNAYYRIISCNVPYAMGSYTRPNGFAVQRIKSPVKFYVNVPEGTEKFTFIAQLYATGHYKLISPNGKVVVENKKVTGYHPHEVNLKKQNLPAGIWTIEILHAHWGYLRFKGIPNFLIMDPEKALIVEETETVKKK